MWQADVNHWPVGSFMLWLQQVLTPHITKRHMEAIWTYMKQSTLKVTPAINLPLEMHPCLQMYLRTVIVLLLRDRSIKYTQSVRPALIYDPQFLVLPVVRGDDCIDRPMIYLYMFIQVWWVDHPTDLHHCQRRWCGATRFLGNKARSHKWPQVLYV